MNRNIKLSVLMISCFLYSKGLAEIDLEVNQASRGTIPVAVAGVTNGGSPALQKVVDVLKRDLQYSEKLQLVHGARQKNAEYIVSVSEQQGQDGHLGFCMRIAYPLQQDKKASAQSTCLEGSEKQLRMIAHQFADRAHAHFTGKANIFTHRIGYVKETNLSGKNKRYQIVVSDFDRHGEQVLLESGDPIMSLVFSPDGKQLAYVSFEEGVSRIFIQDLETGARDVVASFPGVNSAPSWSPDGKKLAMALSLSGVTKLYILDIQSKALRKVTSGASMDTEPFWVQDGSRLVFSSNRSGSAQIHAYDFNQKKVNQLTHHGRYNVAPQMSSDGRYLVYLTKIDRKLQVVVQDMQMQSIRHLGNGNLDDTPRISPSDGLVMYTTANGDKTMLAMVSVDGLVRVPMPDSKSSLKHPSWSPAARWSSVSR